MKHGISLRTTAIASALLINCASVYATNGMLMEGYGPVALSMGGASLAYDNGNAAMMNNPAALQLGANGSRLEVALGVLGPDVMVAGEKSGGSSYVMPAFGWSRKNDQFTWGIGVFGQGGMGTEFSGSGPLAAGTGEPVRSELAVGRVIFPLAYKVNSQLNLGGTLDYTWASLDMRMAALFSAMAGMNPEPTGAFAAMMPTTPAGMAAMASMPVRIDFSDDSNFTGAAKSTGITGKLGATFAVSTELTLAAVYQMKTHLGDMKTSTSGATLTMGMPFTGQMVVRDFQMPSSMGVGAAWQATPQLMLAVDVKKIAWSSVMSNFKMTFIEANGAGTMGFTMPQGWQDQTVISLGAAYRLNEAVTLRAGYSHSTNPVPDATVHPLFPAIVKQHLTAGVGFKINEQVAMDVAVSHAPQVRVTSGQGLPISHSQTNYQFLLSYRY
jgi:long-chain fatty acid transport protein